MRQQRPHGYAVSASAETAAVRTAALPGLADGWMLCSEINNLAPPTLFARRFILNKLVEWLQREARDVCGLEELRGFLAHVSNGHKHGGRWGNPRNTRPVRPKTLKNYYGDIRTFFSWLVAEGRLEASPMDRIPVPVCRQDQIKPLTDADVRALLAAAKRTSQPRRDEAILLLLLDTGLRASELCGLTMADVDLAARLAVVLGKGNKRRQVAFSRQTAKALWSYLQEDERGHTDPLFLSQQGGALTRSSLLLLMRRLSAATHVRGVTVHRWRHTFSVSFLQAGANQFALMTALGHTSTAMTSRYVALADADVLRSMQQFSPVERLKGGGRK